MPNLPFYHEKKDSEKIVLSKQEQKDHDADWEDIKNQRAYRDKQTQKWRWAGSVYNVLQNAVADDRISQITLGWIRSYIDTGISQMTAGEPEFDYAALGPSDAGRTEIWKQLVKTAMNRSNFASHQRISMTDSHVFGPGVMEVYQRRPYRTIRVPKGDGYEEKVIIDHRVPRVGVRAISPFRVTRNPNVSDPNEVGSCTKEDILTWNQFVQNYGRVKGPDGKLKYKHINEIPKGSHVKVTVYQDEIRDVYRIYALAFGGKNEGEADAVPEGLGLPIFDRPLKIHDIRSDKGIVERSLGLNLPGMCNLVFFPYADKLDADFETHSVYGMGLPEHMEGLDTFMQTAFNMTIDNWRMANTVLIGYQSPDGTMPDFDANTYYGGEYVNAQITPQPLGQDKTVNFDNMYEVIQKLSIPATGININQIAGDTSKTAFEFAQRIEANNKRTEMRLKEWEAGPLKRLGTLLLSACISELTVHDLEKVREQDYSKILKDIDEGKATKDDYEFEDGKPVERRLRYYVDMKGWKERFTKKKNSRNLNPDSTDNTLVRDKDNPDAIHKVPVTEQYVFPDWYAESGVLFDTIVDSKRMLTNKSIKDVKSIQSFFQMLLQVVQISPETIKNIDFTKFMDKYSMYADMDLQDIFMKNSESEIDTIMKQIKEAKNITSLSSTPTPNAAVNPNFGQPATIGSGQAGTEATV